MDPKHPRDQPPPYDPHLGKLINSEIKIWHIDVTFNMTNDDSSFSKRNISRTCPSACELTNEHASSASHCDRSA